MEKEENDEMDKAMLSHVIDEADVSGISDLPDLTMDKTGELSAAEDAEKKDDRTVQQILDEAEKKKGETKCGICRGAGVQNGCREAEEGRAGNC